MSEWEKFFSFIAIILVVAFYIGVAYVVAHFLMKFW